MELSFVLMSRGGLDLALCLHTDKPVPAREWDTLIEQLQIVGTRSGSDPQRTRMLVVTDGGAPDARQRSQLGKLWQGTSIVTAVIVPGKGQPLKRGLMTALTWFNPRMAFFVPTELRDALRHVGLEHEQVPLWAAMVELQRRLPSVRTLQRIAEAAHLPIVP